MTTIIANMIVRNEADSYLSQVLTRLQDQVDLICVTDDCSDDDTVDLVKSFDKTAINPNLIKEPLFRQNEGLLRQTSWNFLTTHVADAHDTMILAIDADEELYETGPSLREWGRYKQYDVFDVSFFHMWNETHYRRDGGWCPHGSFRYFRYQPGGVFRDRKLACGSEPTYVLSALHTPRYNRNTGLIMKHLSYIKDEDKQKKYDRYVELDGGEFHAGAHILSIVDPPEKVELAEWLWDD